MQGWQVVRHDLAILLRRQVRSGARISPAVLVDAAEAVLSPSLVKSVYLDDVPVLVDTVKSLGRRSNTSEFGYDALAIVVVDFRNDGSNLTVADAAPAPASGDIFHYHSFITTA